jgi:hypothetical protein
LPSNLHLSATISIFFSAQMVLLQLHLHKNNEPRECSYIFWNCFCTWPKKLRPQQANLRMLVIAQLWLWVQKSVQFIARSSA